MPSHCADLVPPGVFFRGERLSQDRPLTVFDNDMLTVKLAGAFPSGVSLEYQLLPAAHSSHAFRGESWLPCNEGTIGPIRRMIPTERSYCLRVRSRRGSYESDVSVYSVTIRGRYYETGLGIDGWCSCRMLHCWREPLALRFITDLFTKTL